MLKGMSSFLKPNKRTTISIFDIPEISIIIRETDCETSTISFKA